MGGVTGKLGAMSTSLMILVAALGICTADRRADLFAQESGSTPAPVAKAASVNKAQTPLHKAARRGDAQKMRELLAADADPNARDENNWTPLHVAATRGSIEAVEFLLDEGADIHAVAVDDVTPLKAALRKGHVKVAELLRSRGAVR